MLQRTIKTLGVAALGLAIAAVGAGTASAASLPGTEKIVSGLSDAMNASQPARTLPAPDPAPQAQPAPAPAPQGRPAPAPQQDQAAAQDPVRALIGGVPVEERLKKAAPVGKLTGALPVKLLG
ncbi:hypothetical protein GCM10010420_21530 [Streptomyces glaucosporus]|uniref:Secreted protein n=1 Tax=Streptomyces glaucosporus TaxID=284044 RepID=A0ABP5VB15_9ACTN